MQRMVSRSAITLVDFLVANAGQGWPGTLAVVAIEVRCDSIRPAFARGGAHGVHAMRRSRRLPCQPGRLANPIAANAELGSRIVLATSPGVVTRSSSFNVANEAVHNCKAERTVESAEDDLLLAMAHSRSSRSRPKVRSA
jgi:hypothetical protein